MTTGTFGADAYKVPPITTAVGIKQAFVAWLRQRTELKSALVGGIHEGFAPAKTKYPLLKYDFIDSVYDYLWGSLVLVVRIDVMVYAKNSVEAYNLDTLVAKALDDAPLAVDGQTTLICRRDSDLSSPDVDEEGTKIYGVGGSYLIETDQPH